MRAQLQLVAFPVARIEGDVENRVAGQRPSALSTVAVDDHLDALNDAEASGTRKTSPS